MTTQFAATQTDDGSEAIALLRQQRGGLLRRASSDRISVADWPAAAPEAGLAALASARALDSDDLIREQADDVILPAPVVAQLSEADASALGLPPATSLTLQLNSSGSLASGTIAVAIRWTRPGGLPVRADVRGARIRASGRVGRIAAPVYTAFQAARAVNAGTDADLRRAAFAELRAVLGDAIGTGIEADGFLEQVRIAYAANFSLGIKTDRGRFDFDPVLFSRHARESADGGLIDEAEASLLPPQHLQDFQRKFRKQAGGRRSYLLPDGTLLFLDPQLGKALDVVRKRQTGTAEERREFLRAPQRILREALALDATGDDEAADRLFIETQQFSERVSGIEVWQKPVLPWIRPKPNSWLPESFGLRIGEPPDARHIELAPGAAATLADKVETAMRVGEESVVWGSDTIPATPATLQGARAIASLERQAVLPDNPPSDQDDAAIADIFFLQVGENFEQLDYARLPRPSSVAPEFVPPALPAGLKSTPKPHQKDAFVWLAEAWTRQLPGVLLADDMGLGKTFEALLFLLWLRQNSAPAKPVLIVAPTGLLRNWQAELALHVEPGGLGPVIEAFGANLRNFRTAPGTDIRGGTSRLDTISWDEAGIVLTTYETMRDYHMSFARIPFAAIVYDEIQKLKNPASQMTRAAKALNGRLQIAMTGTPVENRLQDLWSIADTVWPGFLGPSREFEKNFPADDMQCLTQLQQRLIARDAGLPPFMLRRMKDDILSGLPEKHVRKYPAPMPAAQAQAYDLVLARARALRESGEPGAMLRVLHMLRGTSLHPAPPRGIADIDAYIAQSARLQTTFEILAGVRQRCEKALLFCEDLEMQAFLAMAIQEKFSLQRRPMCISGKVAGPGRQALISEFRSAPGSFDVLILSPKAGGVGLTITAANNVIHLSRWWNPAIEDQATDRAYRIGQTRPVTIHIPMAIHPDAVIGPASFDRRLDALMDRKRSLSRGLLMPPESARDVEDLLSDVLDGADAPDAASPAPAAEHDTDAGGASARPAPKAPAKAPLPPEARPPAQRPVLSLRTPVAVAEARTPSVRRVEYARHGLRDWTIFEQYARDARILWLEIQDPYCCTDDGARGRLVNFVSRLAGLAAEVGEVRVTAFDADSVQTRDLESTSGQRQDLEARWARLLPSVALRLTQKSRRSNGDLHDRFVKARLENGSTVIWDLGRGIDGVMNARWSCTVNAHLEAPPPATEEWGPK